MIFSTSIDFERKVKSSMERPSIAVGTNLSPYPLHLNQAHRLGRQTVSFCPTTKCGPDARLVVLVVDVNITKLPVGREVAVSAIDSGNIRRQRNPGCVVVNETVRPPPSGDQQEGLAAGINAGSHAGHPLTACRDRYP